MKLSLSSYVPPPAMLPGLAERAGLARRELAKRPLFRPAVPIKPLGPRIARVEAMRPWSRAAR